MKRIIAAALFALFASFVPANAQTASLVLLTGGCGTANYTNGLSYLTVDSTGKLCNTSAASATGGATYAHVAAGQATTVIKNTAGTLYSICFNSAATSTNTTNIYDNASGSGTVIATPAATAVTFPNCLQYGPSGIAFANGLTIITATANGADMTVSFK